MFPRLHPTLRLLPGLLVVVACKSTRPAMDATRDLPARSPEKLIERLTTAEGTDLRYYSAKADVSVEGPDGSRSFKAHLRVVRDSAAWISVVPALGIEVARAVLGTDSLKVLDKLNDHYFLGTLDSAKARFGLQPDLALLQDAVYGKAIGLDPQEKYRADREDGQYVLTSREKKRFVRAAEELAPLDSSDAGGLDDEQLERILEQAEDRDAVVYRYWIDPDDFRVTRVLITDLARGRQAEVRYEERTPVDDRSLPVRIRIGLADGEREAGAIFELSKIALDGPLQLPFRIPAKFTPMD